MIKELELNGGNQAKGIEIDNCDQVGARVFMDQGHAKGSSQSGLLVDGLDNTDVYLKNFYHEGCKQTSVKVIGGDKTSAGLPTNGRVSIFCGASSNSAYSYNIMRNATLLVNDVWYEGSPASFLHLTDSSSGNLTFNGGEISTGSLPKNKDGTADNGFAPLMIDGFRGNYTMINVNLSGSASLLVTDRTKNANVLSMLNGWNDYYRNDSHNPNVVYWASTRYTPGGGATPINDLAKPSDAFLQKMLQQQRTQLPLPLSPLGANITDVRIYRVNVVGATIAFHLMP